MQVMHAERKRENMIVSVVLSSDSDNEIECEQKIDTFNRLAVSNWVVKTRKDSTYGRLLVH